MTTKFVFIGVKLPPDLLARVRHLAQQDGRTLSAYVRRLIARDVAASSITGAER